MCLELYKVVQDAPIEKYRNTFANLALPLFAMSEPVDAKVRTLSCALLYAPSRVLGCIPCKWSGCIPLVYQLEYGWPTVLGEAAQNAI